MLATIRQSVSVLFCAVRVWRTDQQEFTAEGRTGRQFLTHYL